MLEVGLGQQYDKFVAAKPCDDIRAALSFHANGGQFFEGNVSSFVAMPIVNLLELINVDKDQRKRSIISLKALPLGLR